MKMKKNMGKVDRIFRAVASLALIGVALSGKVESPIAIALGALAGIFILTSFVSFCPLYAPFKISTRGKN